MELSSSFSGRKECKCLPFNTSRSSFYSWSVVVASKNYFFYGCKNDNKNCSFVAASQKEFASLPWTDRQIPVCQHIFCPAKKRTSNVSALVKFVVGFFPWCLSYISRFKRSMICSCSYVPKNGIGEPWVLALSEKPLSWESVHNLLFPFHFWRESTLLLLT